MAVDMTCPFRDERNKKCLIYEIRPEICRVFQCNQERDVIVANKMRMHGVNNVVLMRNEFFGNTEDLDFVLNELLGVNE
jgi:Fe-S-cluster containining protein